MPRKSGCEPVWLTLEQVAERAQLSIVTVRRAIKIGLLRSTLINNGRVHRVHVEWADTWLGLETAEPERRPR
jgi:hypothetical protein